MFVFNSIFNKNIINLTKSTKTIYENVIRFDKGSINVLKQVSKHLSRNYSSDPADNEQSFTELGNLEDQKPKETYLVNYESITRGNKELEHKLKVLMLEAEVLRQEGHSVPPHDYIKADMWEILLNSPSRSQRRKYLEYLFKNSKKKENRLLKKQDKHKLKEENKVSNPSEERTSLSVEEHASQYGLTHNNIFLRFHDTAINRFYNGRLVQAMQFGQKIIIDGGYDRNMTRRENYNCAKQLMLLFAENRTSNEPFDIHFTNVNRESDMMKMLHKYIPTMYDLEFPMNLHDESYLDLFPKENLVYLTPHCREEMDSYDPHDIYIIGAIVDKVNNEPLSLAKAKREGIKMKKFPLDQYLQWSAGSGKSLTLNQCLAILLDIKDTGDWNEALKHVPKRKLVDPSNLQDFGNTKENYRFKSNRQRNWTPSYYKRPSYMKSD